MLNNQKTHYLILELPLSIESVSSNVALIPNDAQILILNLNNLYRKLERHLSELEHLFLSIPPSVTKLVFSSDDDWFFDRCISRQLFLNQWFSKLPNHIITIHMPKLTRFSNPSFEYMKDCLPHIQTVVISAESINSMSKKTLDEWRAIFPSACQHQILNYAPMFNHASEKIHYLQKQSKEAFVRTVLALRLVSRASNDRIPPEVLHYIMQYLDFSEYVTVVATPFKDFAFKKDLNPVSTPIVVRQTNLMITIVFGMSAAMYLLVLNASVKALIKDDNDKAVRLLAMSLIYDIIFFISYNKFNGSFTWYEKILLKNSAKDSLLPFFDKDRLNFIKPKKNKLLEIHGTHDDLSAAIEEPEEISSIGWDIENQKDVRSAMKPKGQNLSTFFSSCYSDMLFHSGIAKDDYQQGNIAKIR